jgi:hypothetical protein
MIERGRHAEKIKQRKTKSDARHAQVSESDSTANRLPDPSVNAATQCTPPRGLSSFRLACAFPFSRIEFAVVAAVGRGILRKLLDSHGGGSWFELFGN